MSLGMDGRLLDQDLLRSFVAVADTRSFTRAGDVVGRSQSAVSMQIRRLEERLGRRLFRRSTAEVTLTPAGEALLGYARRMLHLADEAVDRLRGDGLAGRVRLGVMEDYGTLLLPALLGRFAEAYPGVQIDMEIGLTASMPDHLGSRYDLVIAMHAAGSGSGRLLRRDRAVWIAGDRLTEDVRPLPLAVAPEGCLFRRQAGLALDAAGIPWRAAFVTGSHVAAASLVREGLAVMVVKAGLVPPGLRMVGDGLPALPAIEIRLHQTMSAPPAVTALADCLVRALSA